MIDSIVNTQQVSKHSVIIQSNLFVELLSHCIDNCLNKKIQNKYYVCSSSNFSNLLNTWYSDSAKSRFNSWYLVKNWPRSVHP